MQDVASSARTLRELADLYIAHARSYYRRKSGDPTGEHANLSATLDRYVRFAGETADPARITRHAVRAWIDQLAAEKLTRPYINACLSRLRRWVRWAADLEYIPMSIDSELRLVRPLAPLRSSAKEPTPRTPPPLSTIDRVAALLPSPARDVLKLSRLTGARPSELLELTCAEVHIDNAARLTPLQHKNAHKGHHRVIPLSAAAVAIVERHHRPLCPLDRLFRGRGRRGHYTITAYRSALTRACKRAGVSRFVPYDVRHAVARHVRARKGLDAAQALLGHAAASTTEIYAPLDNTNPEAFAAAQRAAEDLQ